MQGNSTGLQTAPNVLRPPNGFVMGQSPAPAPQLMPGCGVLDQQARLDTRLDNTPRLLGSHQDALAASLQRQGSHQNSLAAALQPRAVVQPLQSYGQPLAQGSPSPVMDPLASRAAMLQTMGATAGANGRPSGIGAGPMIYPGAGAAPLGYVPPIVVGLPGWPLNSRPPSIPGSRPPGSKESWTEGSERLKSCPPRARTVPKEWKEKVSPGYAMELIERFGGVNVLQDERNKNISWRKVARAIEDEKGLRPRGNCNQILKKIVEDATGLDLRQRVSQVVGDCNFVVRRRANKKALAEAAGQHMGSPSPVTGGSAMLTSGTATNLPSSNVITNGLTMQMPGAQPPAPVSLSAANEVTDLGSSSEDD